MIDENAQAQTTENQDPKELIPRYRYNEKAKELEDAQALIAKFQREQAEVNERKLTEQGKHEELIAALKPKAERADQLEAAIKAQYETRLGALSEDKRATALQILDLVPTPEGKLAALDNLSPLITTPNRPTPAPMNGGQGNKPDPTIGNLTPDEIQAARLGGLTNDEYLQYKQKHMKGR